jgi:hypothetical protein
MPAQPLNSSRKSDEGVVSVLAKPLLPCKATLMFYSYLYAAQGDFNMVMQPQFAVQLSQSSAKTTVIDENAFPNPAIISA